MKKYDVIVVGGGFAGVAAALAAAREGMRVLLLDKSNCLGGAASNSLVMPFTSYSTRTEDGKLQLNCGIFSEIIQELMHYGAYDYPTFHDETLKLILNRMVQAAGIELLFHAYLYEANTQEDVIRSIKVACIGRTIEFTADCFVDATGNAELSYLAGVPCRLGRERDQLCQPMTLCFRVINVDVEAFYADKPRLLELYKEYQAAGKIKNCRENILTFKTLEQGVVHFNTTRIIKKNPTDPFDLTAAELEAREQVFEMFYFLKEHAPSFQNASLFSTAPEIGVRESRMIDGMYQLTKADLLAYTQFEDAIAAANYDIDVHSPDGSGTSHYYFPPGKYYTIPYRCLVPQKINNLIVAGRCISSDHDAQASYRVMSIVCCLGEAAGIATALCVRGDRCYQHVDVRMLQRKLVWAGAFIGEVELDSSMIS